MEWFGHGRFQFTFFSVQAVIKMNLSVIVCMCLYWSTRLEWDSIKNYFFIIRDTFSLQLLGSAAFVFHIVIVIFVIGWWCLVNN